MAGMRLIASALDRIVFRRPGQSITAGQFLAAAHRQAESLDAAGAPTDGPLLNLCQDRYRFAVGFAAAMLRGQVSLLSSDRSADRLRALAAQFPNATAIADTAPDQPMPVPHLLFSAAVEACGGGSATNPEIPAERLAAIVFTSGSTGAPVGHRKSWGALVARSAAAATALDLPDAVQIVGTVSPQHMYGFETTVLLPLHLGAATWCGPGFYPLDVAHALAALPAPRLLVTTPLHLRALVQSGLTLEPLAGVISATAALPEELAARAEAAWRTSVREIYGATEVGSIATRRTSSDGDWALYHGVTLRGDPDAIEVTAPFADAMPLYDVVEPRAGGRMRLLGRQDDMVKLAGKRTSLASLNRILTGVPGVTDGVFVAPPDLDRRPTARLLAYAVAAGVAPEAILAALRRHIDPVFLPRRVVLVDSLPRNEMGKLPRQALDAWLAGQAAA